MDAFIISMTRAQGAALAVGGYKREAYWWFAAAELFLRPVRSRPGTSHLPGDALEDFRYGAEGGKNAQARDTERLSRTI